MFRSLNSRTFAIIGLLVLIEVLACNPQGGLGEQVRVNSPKTLTYQLSSETQNSVDISLQVRNAESAEYRLIVIVKEDSTTGVNFTLSFTTELVESETKNASWEWLPYSRLGLEIKPSGEIFLIFRTEKYCSDCGYVFSLVSFPLISGSAAVEFTYEVLDEGSIPFLAPIPYGTVLITIVTISIIASYRKKLGRASIKNV